MKFRISGKPTNLSNSMKVVEEKQTEAKPWKIAAKALSGHQ